MLFRSTYRRNYPCLGTNKYAFDWRAILEQVSKEPPPSGSLPHLIMDEGQDFPAEFFLVARHIAKTLTVFADENQRINPENSTLAQIRAAAGIKKVHKLTRNYRNTREIAALAACFYTGLESGIPEPPNQSGDLPVLIGHPTARDTANYILRFERNHPDLEIGVLVPTTQARSRLWHLLKDKARQPVVRYVGGKGAKGLEFDAVFLPELQDCTLDMSRPEAKMMFYVLLARAREHLFLCYSGKGAPKIVQAFPKDLLESRS